MRIFLKALVFSIFLNVISFAEVNFQQKKFYYENLVKNWSKIFPDSNRNAAGPRFFKYLIDQDLTYEEFKEYNKLYCPVSGSLINPGENPDYIFVLGWSQIFKENLLSIPNEFIVGSHPSPLPEGRGRAPVPWTIIQEKKESAITLFKMSKGVDSGEILVQKYFEVPTNSYASELYNVVAENLRDAFSEIYDNIISNKIEFKKRRNIND